MLINELGRGNVSYFHFCSLKTSGDPSSLFTCEDDLEVCMLRWLDYRFDGACMLMSQNRGNTLPACTRPYMYNKKNPCVCVCTESLRSQSVLQQLTLLILTHESSLFIILPPYPQCWMCNFPIQQLRRVGQKCLQVKSDYNIILENKVKLNDHLCKYWHSTFSVLQWPTWEDFSI